MAREPDVKTTLRFVGAGECIPAPGGETACLLLNGTVLVDSGWSAALQLRRLGCDPMALTHVFVTHCHHDHYMGLASLVYYRAMAARGGPGPEPLVIAGPHIDIQTVVERVLGYLQTDRWPEVASPHEVVRLKPGEEFSTDRLRVRTTQVVHPVLTMAYRFDDNLSGASLVVSGDTAPYEPLARFAEGADLLVHEASMGPGSADPLGPWGHAGARDAAEIARAAQVARLYLVHYDAARRQETLESAREVFAETYAAETGETVELPAS
jgi:ribonuclease Z